MPLGSSVTKNLCQDVVKENSTVYMDNYFTSLELLEEFGEKNINIIGTIQKDRTGKAPLPDYNKKNRTWYI